MPKVKRVYRGESYRPLAELASVQKGVLKRRMCQVPDKRQFCRNCYSKTHGCRRVKITVIVEE